MSMMSDQKYLLVLETFVADLVHSNTKSVQYYFESTNFVGDLNQVILYAILTYGFATMFAFLTAYELKKGLALFCLQILLCVGVVFAPTFIPSHAIAVFAGVQNVAFTMTMSQFLTRKKCGRDKNTPKGRFRSIFLSIVTFDISNSVEKVPARFPSPWTVLFLAFLPLAGDVCTFFLEEYNPRHLSATNQWIGISLVGGLWSFLGVEYAYCFIYTLCDLLGWHLPQNYMHKSPALSSSLAEFWGVRWNPIFMKQLQNCYYKPLRAINVPREICTIACFMGSGLMHALPLYLSLKDLKLACMFFAFFMIQGVFLFLETLFKLIARIIILRFNRQFAKVAMPMLTSTPSEIHKKRIQQQQSESKDQLVKNRSQLIHLGHQRSMLEIAVMVMIISIAYSIFEDQSQTSIAVTSSIMIVVLPFVVWYHWRHSVEFLSQGWSLYDKCVLLLLTCLGWLWTLSCLLLTIPLYTLPMLTAVRYVYSQSAMVGPLYRLWFATHNGHPS